MISLMGNCMVSVKTPKESSIKRKLILAILGLDNAGKSVTTKGLQGEPLDTVTPTVGCSTVDFKFEKQDITMFDLGGGKKIRDIWEKYFAEIYGLIYVIDSSSVERMDECQSVLQKLIEHPKIAGKPVLVALLPYTLTYIQTVQYVKEFSEPRSTNVYPLLIYAGKHLMQNSVSMDGINTFTLANKQDIEGALDEIDIVEQLNLEELVSRNKCMCRVETCSAIMGQGKKIDKSIKKGMNWLVTIINGHMTQLHERVEKDTREQREEDARYRKERRERIRLQREQNQTNEEDDGENEMDPAENPFKPVDFKELEKKEARLKEEKRRKQQQEESYENRNGSNYFQSGRTDDSSEIGQKRYKAQRQRVFLSDGEDEQYSHPVRGNRTSNALSLEGDPDDSTNGLRRSSAPSLDKSPRFMPRTMPPSNLDNAELFSAMSTSPELKPRRTTPRPRSISPPPSLTPQYSSLMAHRGDEELESRSPRSQHDIFPPVRRTLAPLEPLNSENDKKKRKKKKKIKRNQTAPSPDDESSDTGENDLSTHIDKTPLPPPRGWGTSSSQRGILRASQSPNLDTVEEPESENDYNSSRTKWNFADDLPELTTNHRAGPNYDDDVIT